VRRPTVILALGALAAGCGARRAGPDAAPAVVIFRNQSLAAAAVYALPRGGVQSRIGTVQPGRTDALRLRGPAAGSGGEVIIVARMLASSGAPTTGPFTLRAGDTVVVTLPPDGRMLSVLPSFSP
jgi:hypothetical protein